MTVRPRQIIHRILDPLAVLSCGERFPEWRLAVQTQAHTFLDEQWVFG